MTRLAHVLALNELFHKMGSIRRMNAAARAQYQNLSCMTPQKIALVGGNATLGVMTGDRISVLTDHNATHHRNFYSAAAAHPDVFVIEMDDERQDAVILRLLEAYKRTRCNCRVILHSNTLNKERLMAFISAGVDDFILRRRGIDLAVSVRDSIEKPLPESPFKWRPENLKDRVLLSTFGITPSETELLVEFCRDFRTHKEIAEETGKSVAGTNKAFSRICAKLDIALGIRSQAALVALLTRLVLW